MSEVAPTRSICGLWVSPEGTIHLSLADPETGRREVVDRFAPFCWAETKSAEALVADEVEIEPLNGPGRLNRMLRFSHMKRFREYVAEHGRSGGVEWVRSMESQFLIDSNENLYGGMRFADLRRCQCDIETSCSVPGGFSNARRAGDRILAIGLQFGDRRETLLLGESTDEGERRLLLEFSDVLHREDPDTIEGHNIYRFDLDFLRQRCRRFEIPCAWGRFGQTASFRSGRLRVAERSIDFPRCDIPGRLVFDTYLMILIYDLTRREMASYGLKEVALHLGISGQGSGSDRTYIAGCDIQKAFSEDRERFIAYLNDDLRETRGIADLLLPTYFAQASSFPMTLQEATLRGSGGKVDLLMLQEYFRAKQALPDGQDVKGFAGGFTRSYEAGVFRNVWHFDVASLYPSLLLNLGRNPVNDSLGAFIPMLKKLREYRLRYKNLARNTTDEELRSEHDARQSSYKILINSFYGYLGFSGARFADGDLAAEVTREGRELLQRLIEQFQRLGSRVLEADTDGIYLVPPEDCDEPERLLEKVSPVLPPGIELEFDGRFEAMFSYKAKNYAIYDGRKIVLRGSALRSRGMEPFLRRLTEHLIRWLLGLEERNPRELVEEARGKIARHEIDVTEIARSENLSQNPQAYREAIEKDPSRQRRSALEAALRSKPQPRMGDRVTFYIARSRTGMASRDWERAIPVEQYDPAEMPYDAEFYMRKLNEWVKRYEEFFLPSGPKPVQGELF